MSCHTIATSCAMSWHLPADGAIARLQSLSYPTWLAEPDLAFAERFFHHPLPDNGMPLALAPTAAALPLSWRSGVLNLALWVAMVSMIRCKSMESARKAVEPACRRCSRTATRGAGGTDAIGEHDSSRSSRHSCPCAFESYSPSSMRSIDRWMA